MKKTLRICTISMTYEQRTVAQNIKVMTDLLEEAAKVSPDMVCLPETSPYTSVPIEQALRQAEPVGGRITEIFGKIAKKKGFWIIFGMFEKHNSHYHNSCVVLDNNGKVAAVYRKMFPTLGELENGVIPGKDVVVLDSPWGRIGFAICFDMNFHEVMDSLGEKKAKLVFFLTYFHGGLLNSAYCLRNSHYIAAARITGVQQKIGAGFIVDPFGKVIKKATPKNLIIYDDINLDFVMAHKGLHEQDGRLQNLLQKCSKKVAVDTIDAEELIKITSLVEGKSAEYVAQEFGIELFPSYLARARKLRKKVLRSKSEICS